MTANLLVRYPGPVPAKALGAASSRSPFELEPLFELPTHLAEVGLAPASRPGWYIARPKKGAADQNPWDVAHEALKQGPMVATGPSPLFIEPDVEQTWIHGRSKTDQKLGAASSACVFTDQDQELPFRPADFAWHLADRFSELATARSSFLPGKRIPRIAHLDTGYDPDHRLLPSGLRADLGRSFVAGDSPESAVDRGIDGVLRNPGHGTGTLGILAGGRFRFAQEGYSFEGDIGGAPRATVVPVRVGNSVVQLTTSSVARGIMYAVGLCADEETRIDVISMSMGGVASAAWADAVNLAYEAGIVYVAAAGNNFSSGFFGFPTRHIVYPARFRRVIAACGVMADRTPYFGLKAGTMQGNWGPSTAMGTALSAFTPNIPWARWHCKEIVRMDGAGTSSATPQIAAAAALYFEKYGKQLFDSKKYPEPWMRVELVRQALYLSADRSADGGSRERLGNGILRAAGALQIEPSAAATLQKVPPDRAGFPFLNVLSGRSLAPSAAETMFELEATQLVHRWDRDKEQNPLERAVVDPDRASADVPADQVIAFLEALSEHSQVSKALKARAKSVLDTMVSSTRRRALPGGSGPPPKSPRAQGASLPPASVPTGGGKPQQAPGRVTPPMPPHRRLRGYSLDPSLTTLLNTVDISETTFTLPWEKLKPGPVGEYLEVMDIDPATEAFYEPVDLDDPLLLAQDGLPPSEGVPQFHQQMVYAVCSLTIENFERALGRKTLWRPMPAPGKHPKDDSQFVRQLRVYPHALRDKNAYYSPQKVALLFGYFNAQPSDAREHLPGGKVFTCLSHDIVAHETTHALLDGMHRRFLLPSNPDVLAFHEAFADSVALLQHFTFPELVAHQIVGVRGDIRRQENLLVQLASQFGVATGRSAALRDAIGEKKDGVWALRDPDPKEYEETQEPHDRGRILVSAVFDAFLSIYNRRTVDLMRLATGGSGVLRSGAIHPDLAGRLAAEAVKSAKHVLTMCIRALDYCPPTDITFGEYLRAVITADYDLVADDDLNYRVSFIEAFRRRGIFPPSVRTLSVGSLLWHSPRDAGKAPSKEFAAQLEKLREMGHNHQYAESRAQIFQLERKMRFALHAWLDNHLKTPDGACDGELLGLDPGRRFEVHSARIAQRWSPDGQVSPQLLVGLLQSTEKPVHPGDPDGPKMGFEGGCTVVADLREREIRYCIRKHLGSETRLARQQKFALQEFDSLRATYRGARSLSGDDPEPFALLHRCH